MNKFYVEWLGCVYWVKRENRKYWKMGPFNDSSDAAVVCELLNKGELLLKGDV